VCVCVCVCVCVSVCVCVGNQPRALHMLGKCPSTELHPQARMDVLGQL
jgi:hypothetical protein